FLVNSYIAGGFSHSISDNAFANTEQEGFYAAYKMLQPAAADVLIEGEDSNLVNIIAVILVASVFLPDPMQTLVTMLFINHGQFRRSTRSNFPYDIIMGHLQDALYVKGQLR